MYWQTNKLNTTQTNYDLKELKSKLGSSFWLFVLFESIYFLFCFGLSRDVVTMKMITQGEQNPKKVTQTCTYSWKISEKNETKY